jgi:protein ImuB
MPPLASFAAVYVPNFILQAIGRSEPELRTQPLAILDGPSPTYRVIACNRLAKLLGVTLGITKSAASQFARLAIRSRCQTREAATHAALLDVAWSITPRVEDAAQDTLLLDLSGLTSLYPNADAIAPELVSRAASLGLEIHVAISANIETARVVARALPGPTIIPAGEERRFLETLPVNMLLPGPELAGVFHRWGIETCKQLASLPLLSLSECVGQQGVRLHEIAGGGGSRPLLLAEPSQHFEEWLELDEPVDDLESLSFLLGRLLDQLCARLTARSLSIAAIHTEFELQPSFDSDFDTARDLLRVKPSPKLFPCLLEMPVPTRDSKLLLKLLRLRLQSSPPGAPVQKIRMAAHSSLARVTQGSLFVPASPDPDKLELTIARIAAVVGAGNVGSPQPLDSHQPDAFRMQKFTAGSAEPRQIQTGGAVSTSTISAAAIALHTFRPPLPARVRLQSGKPFQVFFQGLSGKVIRASGPWRTSGLWWEENSWQHDDWDLEIAFPNEAASAQIKRNFSDHTRLPGTRHSSGQNRQWLQPNPDRHSERSQESLFLDHPATRSDCATPSSAPHSEPPGESSQSDPKFRPGRKESLCDVAFFRFFYDPSQEKWFVRGVYD